MQLCFKFKCKWKRNRLKLNLINKFHLQVTSLNRNIKFKECIKFKINKTFKGTTNNLTAVWCQVCLSNFSLEEVSQQFQVVSKLIKGISSYMSTCLLWNSRAICIKINIINLVQEQWTVKKDTEESLSNKWRRQQIRNCVKRRKKCYTRKSTIKTLLMWSFKQLSSLQGKQCVAGLLT